MEHVRLLASILILAVGCGVAFVLYGESRRRHPEGSVFPSLLWHHAAFNVLILVLIFSKYIDLNLPGWKPALSGSVPDAYGAPAVELVLIFMSYQAVRAVLALKGPAAKRTARPAAAAFAGYAVFCLAVRLFNIPLAEDVKDSLVVPAIAAEVLVLIRGLVTAGKAGRKAGIVRGFARLYLSRYAVLTVLLAVILRLGLPPVFKAAGAAAVLLYFNLIPYIWLRTCFLPNAESLRAAAVLSDLAPVYERFAVTPREQEICGLILQGRTNREIGRALFISPSTVKNHLSSIFRKCGVRSRHGLVGLFLQKR